MKVRLKIPEYWDFRPKLRFVKLLSKSSDLPLKESKLFLDNLLSGSSLIINITDKKHFYENIKEFDKIIDFTYIDIWKREHKLLKLGLGTDEEYINFITNYITSNNNKEKIPKLFENLNKKQLIEIISNIK